MNILILSWRGPGHPSAGGAEAVTFEHAKAWVNGGHEVTLFTSFYVGAKKDEIIEGVRIKRSGRQFFGVQINAFFWYLFGKHAKIDLVVDEFHGLPFFTPFYVRARKLGFIHEVAGEVWKLNPWPKPFNLIPSIIGTYFEPLLFLFYKKIPFMTVSESTKKDLTSWKIPSGNINVVHNGVNLDLPQKSISKEKTFTAMYLGAISEDKGTQDAVRTFAEINRKDDEWQFWIVGSGTKDLVKKLKVLAEELGISEKLKFWGFVTDKKRFELLKKAHVLINPSIHEGWGLVNIEANAVETPIIAYSVHGIRDSVRDGETGILVEKGDYRRLAENAIKLVKDRQKYHVFQGKAKKWSKRFTWEKATKESTELIESL